MPFFIVEMPRCTCQGNVTEVLFVTAFRNPSFAVSLHVRTACSGYYYRFSDSPRPPLFINIISVI